MKRTILSIVTMFALVLSGCSASNQNRYTQDVAMPAAPPNDYTASAKTAYSENAHEISPESYDLAAADKVPASSGSLPTVPVSLNSKKIVYSVNLQMQTTEFDAGVNKIKASTQSVEGFVQTSYVEGKGIAEEYIRRNASITVRVPAAKLDAFISNMKANFNVVREEQFSEDISGNYYDTQARLKSLATQEQLLTKMLGDSTELKYMIEVAKELQNIRYEIETLTSAKLRMDADVEFSTVSLELQEVFAYDEEIAPPITFGVRVSQTFHRTWINLINFCENTVLVLISLLPLLVCMLLIGGITYWVLRWRKNKTQEKQPIPPTTLAEEAKDKTDNG